MVESEELKLLKSKYYTPIQSEILQLLKEHERMTRDDFCRELGYGKHTYNHVQSYPNKKEYRARYHIKVEQYYKRTTIYDNLVKLEKRNLVEKFSYNNGERGRPEVFWQLRGD